MSKSKNKTKKTKANWQAGQIVCRICKHFLVAGKYATESDIIKIGGITG